MARSRLPVPSLLGLYGALLMLSPELLMGIPDGFSHAPTTDPGVQKALAFAVDQYNQDRNDSANYFKQLNFFEAQTRVDAVRVHEYHLTVELVKTTCKKKAGRKRKYKRVQKCKQKLCYFIVITSLPPLEFDSLIKYCVSSAPP